jgi:hypothetical protein
MLLAAVAGVHGHHVGRALAGVNQQRSERQRVLAIRHPFVGLAQAAAQLHCPYCRGDVRCVVAGDHRTHVFGVVIGTVRQCAP